MPPSAHKPTPGLGDAVADGDPVEWAYRRRSAWLEDAWRGPASQVDDVDDMMGIQRADAPDDIQQMSLAAQTAYVSAFNQHMEENPDDGFAECDQAGRDAIEALGPQDSLADAVAHLERVRDAIHAEQKRKLSEAWRQR